MPPIKIPPQLKGWRFVLIPRGKKKPFEDDWPRTANYSYNDSKLLEHLKRGGNYGVVGSEDHVIVDGDTPEIQQAMEEHLPLTFTVRTPGHQGRHYYFLCKFEESIRLRDKNKVIVGDIQGIGKQVVGPNCIHPNGKTYEIVNDRPPNWIAPDDLKRALNEFIIKEPPVEEFAAGERKAFQGEGIGAGIKIIDVHSVEGMRQRGDEYEGPHPVHGSDGAGHNFSINPNKNVWVCRRHDTGGGALSLLAVKEGIIKCEDATRGALRGETFKKVLELARSKGLLEQTEDPKPVKEPAPNIRAYFVKDGKTSVFVPKALADEITKDHHFATHRKSWDIYYYRDGYYSLGGEAVIRELSRQKLGRASHVHYVNEVVQHIQDTTFRNAEDFEVDRGLICLENGIYNLDTGELSEHTPDLLFLAKIPIKYDPNAKAPNSFKRLYEWMNEDDVIRGVQFLGFSLYRDYFIRKALIAHGGGGNGKTTFITYIGKWLGRENTCAIPVQDLDKNRFAAARLYGRHANLCDDLPSYEWFGTGRFKQATGGGQLEGENKYKDSFPFYPYAKMGFTANKLPIVSDDTRAFWERILLIEFANHYTGSTPHDDIWGEMLTPEECSGMLNAALIGLRMLRRNGDFYKPEDIELTKTRYKKASDPVVGFVDAQIVEDADGFVIKEELYGEYKRYCAENGFSPALNSSFSKTLNRVIPNTIRTGRITLGEGGDKDRPMIWRGIRLKTTEELEGDTPPPYDPPAEPTKEDIKDVEAILAVKGVKGVKGPLPSCVEKKIIPYKVRKNTLDTPATLDTPPKLAPPKPSPVEDLGNIDDGRSS